ncbi:MAG: copper resistance protein NlpE [Bacteroides sp.]|nr:copper resistance protein NlpE [Bacteroides sp.]
MKKAIYAAAAVAMLGLSACTGNTCDSKGCKVDRSDDKVYTGVLPAADCDGIRYTLKLDYDDDNNYTDGDYDLVQTYIGSDSTSMTGYKDISSFKSKGDFTVIKGEGANAGKTFLKLVEDAPKGKQGDTMYFIVDSDSAVTMTNADFEMPPSGLNYTLRLVK